jgi:hypothetical protein
VPRLRSAGVRSIGIALATLIVAVGCGGGGDDTKAEAHVCGYLISDATDGARQALLAFQSGDETGTVDALHRDADQIRKDVSTLPEGDKIRAAGEAVARSDETFAAAITANSGLGAAAKAMQKPGDELQTLCRAVTP